MKANLFVSILLTLILNFTALQLPAQQTETDRKAFEKIKVEAEKGDVALQFWLAVHYANGDSVAKDWTEAAKWMRRAAEKGFAEAQVGLGGCYYYGNGVTKDLVEAVKWCRKAADQGMPQAQFNLGAFYAIGSGVSKDLEEAARWCRKAADQGMPQAQCTLGAFYTIGSGVSKDLEEAAEWYRKAAEQGLPIAQDNLGLCYYTGNGVPKDFTEAVKWYRKAAEQGFAWAQASLGSCYFHGHGVPRDTFEAVKWYRRAAEQGYSKAQMLLGGAYYLGEGVAKDADEAMKWFRRAAEQGYRDAQAFLGGGYETGDGAAKDYVEAHKWFNLASAQGSEIAKESLLRVEQQMTVMQIAEAQRLARQFKPRTAPDPGPVVSSAVLFDSRPLGSGTGFFISTDGFLVTNQHVVSDTVQLRLVTSAGLIAAKVVKVDAANDLALLKAEGRFTPLPVVASRSMRLGSTVATVGFPNIGLQGFAPKLAKGEIAALTGAQDDSRYFQISVPVQPGNSGGALVDERGNVVGVVSAKLNASTALSTSGALPENVNYAVKSSFLLSFLESVPEVVAKLIEPNTRDRKFEDVVKSAEEAAVLVLVY